MVFAVPLSYDDTEESAGELRLRSSNKSASLRRVAALKSTTFRYLVVSRETKVGSVSAPSTVVVVVRCLLAEKASTAALRLLLGCDGNGPRAINRLRVEFQRFLMALSVRPGRRLAISAHRLPSSTWAWMIALSSSSVHSDLLMSGFK